MARFGTFGPTWRAAAGFWSGCRRAEGDQQQRKRPTDPTWREAAWRLGRLPGQPKILDDGPGKAEMGVSQQHQPGPAVRLLGVPHPWRGPVQHLFEEPECVLQIEPPDVRTPEDGQVWDLVGGSVPPQPEHLWRAYFARQPADFHQHEDAVDDRTRTSAAPSSASTSYTAGSIRRSYLVI